MFGGDASSDDNVYALKIGLLKHPFEWVWERVRVQGQGPGPRINSSAVQIGERVC